MPPQRVSQSVLRPVSMDVLGEARGKMRTTEFDISDATARLDGMKPDLSEKAATSSEVSVVDEDSRDGSDRSTSEESESSSFLKRLSRFLGR